MSCVSLCCPASAPANLCPLASMCSHIVHLRPCLLSVRLFIYDRACLVLATYVHTCVMSVFFYILFFFTRMMVPHDATACPLCVTFPSELI